jgi:hypothetical protein
LIRGGKQGVDFWTRQEVDQRAGEAFARDGEYPLDLGGMDRCFESCVVKEGMDCREAKIPRANANALVLLKLIEERDNQRSIDVREVQPGRWLMQALLHELQKLPEGVAIGTDGVRTRLALLHQALREEAFQ